MTTLRLAVISDIHAHAAVRKEGLAKASHVVVGQSGLTDLKDPFLSLETLISDESLTADYVICCGDLADKADPTGARYAWQRLEEIRNSLEAREVLAVSGNHDMDSRFIESDYDAKGVLLELSPSFPVLDEINCNKYWARNYVVLDNPECRIVLLNTSAYHGYSEEYKHGRISSSTLRSLEKDLQDQGARPANILICHHHPIKLGSIDTEDYSEINGAPALIELLGSGRSGNWLIIHGHRHWPELVYAAGGSDAPVIFSAGSFSAILWDEISTIYKNQFYLIDVEIPSTMNEMRGKFQSWEWLFNQGWKRSGADAHLPSVGGFGERTNPRVIATRINDLIGSLAFMRWTDLLLKMPEIEFMIPRDLIRCSEILLTEYSIEISHSHGKATQIGRVK